MIKYTILSSFLFFTIWINAQNVNIPDANFKALLVNNSSINTNLDSEIQVTEANTYAGGINIGSGSNISNLIGLEQFTSLTDLSMVGTLITSLNVSQNTALNTLSCGGNPQLVTLITSGANALTYLSCAGSPLLTNVDLTQNTALTELSIYSNNLTSLNVTQNTLLINLNCRWNSLSSLNVSSNVNLSYLDCYGNQLSTLDVSSNINLTGLDCQYNNLTSLNISSNALLTYLGCSGNLLTSLNTIGANSLVDLSCENNNLTTLDLSQNLLLSDVRCRKNNLTSLDLTGVNLLTKLYCDTNQLTSLDLSQKLALDVLDCRSNQLNCLNVANGFNTQITEFYANNNAPLICIEVDNAAWATANWNGNHDSQSLFSENCNNACSSTVGIQELTSDKKLIKTTDLMGREINPNTQSNILLINYYDNGTFDKVFISPK
jgi:Leucine-rich repeat (LRR) protein